MKNSWKVVALLLFAVGCSPQSYEEMLEQELASGEINTDLFLGIHFDMASKDFYEHCWKLNKDQVIRQGPGNLSIQFEPEELDYPGTVNFYPDFYNGKIINMPMMLWLILSKKRLYFF